MEIETLSLSDIRKQFSYSLSVITSTTEFKETKSNTEDFRKEVEEKLKKDYSFRKVSGSLYSEGLVEFKSYDNCLECIYAKQSNLIVRNVNGLSLEVQHIKNIASPNMVKIRIFFEKNKVDTTYYGGSPAILSKAMEDVNVSIRSKIRQHRELEASFTKEDMRKILDSFGDDISEIKIDPGDSEKLRKITEEGNGNPAFELLYEAHVTFVGIKVKRAPYVRQLVDDGDIFIRQIKGKITYAGTKISSEVSSSGRVNFILPTNLVEEEKLNDIGIKLYNDIVEKKIKVVRSASLDTFIGTTGE